MDIIDIPRASLMLLSGNKALTVAMVLSMFVSKTKRALLDMQRESSLALKSRQTSPNRLSGEFIFNWFQQAGSLFRGSSSHFLCQKEVELFSYIAEMFHADEPNCTDSALLDDILEMIPYMLHPSDRDDRASKAMYDKDAELVRCNKHREVQGTYAPIELCLFHALGSEASKVKTIADASSVFSLLTQKNIIRDVTTKSIQDRTVRWSITCRVVVKGVERIVITPYCAGRMIARGLVLALTGFLTQNVKKHFRSVNLMAGGAIYDREKLGRVYKSSRKLVTLTESLDVSDYSLAMPSENTKVSVSALDPSSLIGFHCLSTLTPIDPNKHLEELRADCVSDVDFLSVFGSGVPKSVALNYGELPPAQKLLAAIRNRAVLRRRRESEGRPNWNKDACMGLPLDIMRGRSFERNAVRTTMRVLTVLSDTMNKLALDNTPGSPAAQSFIFVINWAESFDVTVLLCFAVMMRIELLVKIGSSEVFLNKRALPDGSYTYAIATDLTREEFSCENFLWSLREYLVAANKPCGERLVLISGGLAQTTVSPIDTWHYATNVMLNSVKFSECQADLSEKDPGYDWLTVRYSFVDFVLPDNCELCSPDVGSLCGIHGPSDTVGDQCDNCRVRAGLAERFELFVSSSSVSLVKPRYAYGHNTHIAYEYDVFQYAQYEDAVDRVDLCLSSILCTDVWRMSVPDDTTLVYPSLGETDAQGPISAGREHWLKKNASQRGKLAQAAEIRRAVIAGKIGPVMLKADLSTVFHVDKISDDSSNEDAANYFC